MLKLFTLKANEEWIVDRFYDEWISYNTEIHTKLIDANVVWLLAGWCWNHIPTTILTNRTIVCTVHHIDPYKFDIHEFMIRDKYVDVYHVPCMKTHQQLSQLTHKRIVVLPFWVNDKIWYDKEDKFTLRQSYDIPNDKFIIGSFQRDTEGHDLKTPKLSKGPDIFCDVVGDLSKVKDVHVLLAGWRREYVKSRLSEANIPFTYIDRPQIQVVNDLYNMLDLYVVGSRHEGGPQAIFECAATKTPIISTDVGYASELLSTGIYHDRSEVISAYESITHQTILENHMRVNALFQDAHMSKFIELFNTLA